MLGVRKLMNTIDSLKMDGDPYGTRTRVFAVKGRCPRPLDEGVTAALPISHTS